MINWGLGKIKQNVFLPIIQRLQTFKLIMIQVNMYCKLYKEFKIPPRSTNLKKMRERYN